MTDTPVSFLSADPSTHQDSKASVQEELATLLHVWVTDCLDNGVQELDTMIMTAPESLRSQFCCYDVMADEIEMVVQRIWTDLVMQRMRRRTISTYRD